MGGPRIGELFAGYGGLGMGVQAVYGGDIVWVSEFDKGPSKILEHRFPGVPNHGDITKIDWSKVEPVDILTGGSPCQDLSHAGRRAGMTEGTRSNLWVAMREAIAQLRPARVIWENVRGAYSAAADSEVEWCDRCVARHHRGGKTLPALRALGRVLGDLSDLGYDAQWHGLRAADVGGPHGRFRVFVAAFPADQRHEWAWASRHRWPGPADGDRRPLSLLPTPMANEAEKAGQTTREDGGQQYLTHVVHALLPTPRTKNNENRQSEQYAGEDGNFYGLLRNPGRWGDYAAAITRWERIIGRPAPEPTQISTKGNPQLSARFVEWMMGLPAGWVTDIPGITRNEALKALGNGVVPQQAAEALRVMASWAEAA